jgi:hypothetical protein
VKILLNAEQNKFVIPGQGKLLLLKAGVIPSQSAQPFSKTDQIISEWETDFKMARYSVFYF